MSKEKKVMKGKVKLKNVRLSWPHLFEPTKFNDDDNSIKKYDSTFLISKKDKIAKKQIDAAIKEVLNEVDFKVKKEMICIKDGDDFDADGYPGNWVIKASNKKRPTIVGPYGKMDNQGDNINDEGNEIIYAGCYVGTIIGFWVQNNKYGKRVNANLMGVKFYKDGKHFVSSVDVFDELEEFDDFDDLDHDSDGDEDYDDDDDM